MPERLKNRLGPLNKISEVPIKYGNDQVELHPTYLTKIYIDSFELDAEVYFRPSDYILIGLNVLNQLKLFADGKSQVFTVEDP